ncbi:MAG: hypothetical protein GY726_08900 [Proteobacteria bacterium]|nr:hypothetical protein [Pseudomonadota bacterium]
MENPELGNQFYAKAEGRITSPGDLIKLAEAMFDANLANLKRQNCTHPRRSAS